MSSPLESLGDTIDTWDGTDGWGHDDSGTMTAIGTNTVIASAPENINTNGQKNTYTYTFDI